MLVKNILEIQNFGIIPALNEKIKDKKIKYGKLADRALEDLKKQ